MLVETALDVGCPAKFGYLAEETTLTILAVMAVHNWALTDPKAKEDPQFDRIRAIEHDEVEEHQTD